MPKTLSGWLVEAVAGVVVFFYGWACIEIILWLQARTDQIIQAKALGILVALSLGAGVFVAAYFGRQFLVANFEYF